MRGEPGALVVVAGNRLPRRLLIVACGSGRPLSKQLHVLQLRLREAICKQSGPALGWEAKADSLCLFKVGTPRARDASERHARRRPFMMDELKMDTRAKKASSLTDKTRRSQMVTTPEESLRTLPDCATASMAL